MAIACGVTFEVNVGKDLALVPMLERSINAITAIFANAEACLRIVGL
jgi:hypothetical protein